MGEKRKKKRKGKAECKSRWRGDENGTHEKAETDEKGKIIPRRNHIGEERKYMRGHEVELQGGAEITCLLECLVAKFEFVTQ
jgi:hypothetical protein